MKRIILTLLSGVITITALSQSCPPNLDIEKGNLKGWDCFIGTTYTDNSFKNIIDLQKSLPMQGRHEVISAADGRQLDPYGKFPTLCPYGGDYSVKLGNDQSGNEAEGISYTFTIPADVDTLTFTYFYAVVFEDPQHAHSEQPRFFVTAYDVVTGGVINCASYDYVATGSLPGFTPATEYPGVLYKDWSPVSLQFAGLNGRSVRLEFKTADCTQGAHFGYAYLDVGTACSNILATAPYCVETNSLILNAPYGFKDYTWYNGDYSKKVGSGQTITLSPPPVQTGTFFVDMVPYPGFGCRDTASATVKPLPVPPVPVFDTQVVVCQYSAPQALVAEALKDHDILWYDHETGGIPRTVAPVVTAEFADTIDFYLSQKRLFGCESNRKRMRVIILPTPVAGFSINDAVQCQSGNQFAFTSESTNLVGARYYWDFGDGQSDKKNKSLIDYRYKKYGEFEVTLRVENLATCSHEMKAKVTVIPAPVADFQIPEPICEQQPAFVISDKSIVPGNMASLESWEWMVGGQNYHTQTIPPVTPGNAKSIHVQLLVKTTNGCTSDTLVKTIPVRRRPVADFTHAATLCNNELIMLKDASGFEADATAEQVSKWQWTFDGQPASTLRNPNTILTAGMHRVELISTSVYGCASLPVEKQLLVHQKPEIGLRINDSCVFRLISYKAEDRSQSVESWHWDTGDGLREGSAGFTRSYREEGDQSLILIGTTVEGCRDTVRRPFYIYQNKSDAGADTLVARNQPVQLDAHGPSDMRYIWSPQEGLNDPAAGKPVALLDRDQRYTLYSISKEGCDKKSDIFIQRYHGPDIYMPNAFTPNADGHNDKLQVLPVGIKTFLFLTVYNRFGQQVFHTTDKHQGWDGKFNGRPQDSGTYVAVSKAIDYNGKIMSKRETVLLVR